MNLYATTDFRNNFEIGKCFKINFCELLWKNYLLVKNGEPGLDFIYTPI